MKWADMFVLVLSCGGSEHLELGWAVGQGTDTVILLSQPVSKPALMYRMVDLLATSIDELTDWLHSRPAAAAAGSSATYDLTGGRPGSVLEPETPIRLTIESVAGEGWDGDNEHRLLLEPQRSQ